MRAMAFIYKNSNNAFARPRFILLSSYLPPSFSLPFGAFGSFAAARFLTFPLAGSPTENLPLSYFGFSRQVFYRLTPMF